jgi:hypothetical protein
MIKGRRIAVIQIEGLQGAAPFVPGNTPPPAGTPGTTAYIPPGSAPPAATGPTLGTLLLYGACTLAALGLISRIGGSK